MVSKIAKRKTPLKHKASPCNASRRRRRHHLKKSPLKALAAAPSAVLRSCRRRLLDLFACLAILSTPTKPSHRQRCRLSPDPDNEDSSLLLPKAVLLPPSASPEKKTIFLDLDETLVHSQAEPHPVPHDFTVHPRINGGNMTFYVLKRPGVDEFLREIAKTFEVVVFTAGLKEYASSVLDRLDPAGDLISRRLYRDSCKEMEGKLVKDLSALGRPMHRVAIVDDNPNAYALQPENAVPVRPFVNDLADRELWRVMEFLKAAAGFEDVRDAIACCLGSNREMKDVKVH